MIKFLEQTPESWYTVLFGSENTGFTTYLLLILGKVTKLNFVRDFSSQICKMRKFVKLNPHKVGNIAPKVTVQVLSLQNLTTVKVVIFACVIFCASAIFDIFACF